MAIVARKTSINARILLCYLTSKNGDIMVHRKNNLEDSVSTSFIHEICSLYDDCYDDRLEDSRPPTAGKKNGKPDKREAGADWMPGMPAGHKSLNVFQKELKEKQGICISTSKIRKILITGNLWSTDRSREIKALYDEMSKAGTGVNPEEIVGSISKKLGISKTAVVINLPYINGVNRLEPKSKNALRCSRYRQKKKENNES